MPARTRGGGRRGRQAEPDDGGVNPAPLPQAPGDEGARLLTLLQTLVTAMPNFAPAVPAAPQAATQAPQAAAVPAAPAAPGQVDPLTDEEDEMDQDYRMTEAERVSHRVRTSFKLREVFHGKETEDVERWMRAFNNQAQMVRARNADKLAIIPNFLSGRALDWYNGDGKTALPHVQGPFNRPLVKVCLIRGSGECPPNCSPGSPMGVWNKVVSV